MSSQQPEGEGFLNEEEIQEVVNVEDTQSEVDENEIPIDGVEAEEDLEGNGEDEMAMDEDEGPNDSVAGFYGHTDAIYCVAINPVNEDMVATGGGDDKAYIWSATNGDRIHELLGHTDSVVAIGFSTNGKYLATGGMDGKVKIWDSETGKLGADLEGPDEVIWLNWHPKGNIVLAGGQDGSTWMWAANGQVMQVFSGHTAPVTCGGFSPDGKLVVTGSEDSTIVVWDPKSANPLFKFTPADSRLNQSSITALAFNPDSTILLTGSADHVAKMIHAQNGKLLASFENHTESIETISFSPVLPLVATGGVDGRVSIWDVQTLRLRHTLQHNDAVVKVLWQASEANLITCSMDRKIRQWEVRTGTCLRVINGHVDPVLDIALTKDGKTLISTSDDHRAFVFKL